LKVLDQAISQLTLPTPFAVGDTHVYLIKGDVLSLVDAGVKTKEAEEALTAQLKQLGYHMNDIEQIILTHHHPDHIGLIEQFPRAKWITAHKNVDLWLRRDKHFLQQYEHFFSELYDLSGIPEQFDFVLKKIRAPLQFAGTGALTDIIDDGDILPGHSDWKVIETKGHAQSHLSFLREHDGIFIGGDHMLKHISSNPLLEPPLINGEERPKPLLQYRDNLQKCLSLDIRTVLPGHGETFTDIDTLIPERLKKQEHRAAKAYGLLLEKSLTPFQLCQKLFPEHYETELDLTLSETIGQLDFLEERGKCEKLLENGVLIYHAK
jgi:glyoxylase-like metal-dependent hydrolase (beta-lactamase superfamily II)